MHMPWSQAAPEVEVVSAGGAGVAPEPGQGVMRGRRLRVFFLVFLICAVAGLIWDFSRPAVYRASASLLIVPPPDADQAAPSETDLQHTAVQRQILLGQEVLQQTLEQAVVDGVIADPSAYSLADLRGIFAVDPEAGTQVVQLHAEGGEPERLAGLVNAWAMAYAELRGRQAAESVRETTQALEEEHRKLAEKIEAKRGELERFREEHEILSLGRDENEVLARLKGLTDSINKAREEAVNARARLAAVRKAIERGEPVLPRQDQATLSALEARAQELREQLAELDQRYTRDFLALEPTLKVIPEQLAELEKKIQRMKEYGQRIVLSEAEQAYAAARQAVRELEARLEAHKRKAMEFTTQFARHEALQEDLARLEELYRLTEERLVRLQVQDQQRRPPVTILEYAQAPQWPLRPAYLRDAALVFALALVLGLFAVWLVEFLTGRNAGGGAPVPLAIRVWGERGRMLEQAEPGVPAMPGGATPELSGPSPRELSVLELEAMLKAAGPADRQLLILLLNGLSPEELAALDSGEIDLETGRIQVGGEAARIIELPPRAVELLRETAPVPAWDVHADARELGERLALVAVDAGIPSPEQVDAWAVRHSHIVFLVRQGLRMSELPRLVGPLSTAEMTFYSRFSPAEPGRPLEEIERLHPALRALAG